MIPASIASYRIVRQLGEGGMGVVYEAVHDSLGRRAAIKVLHPEFSQNAQIRARFFNEARAVNMVQHPGIVSIYEFGESPDGSTFLIMEFLEGDSLRKRVKQYGGPMPFVLVVRLGRQMASALAAAHKMKIVHRDLKPDNVMLVADPDVAGGERAKLLDFGIAKVADDPKNPGGGVKTRTGMMMGTPAYMAPEQCRGAGEVDERADVYSLGILFYEMLTGRPPFTDSAPGELIARHLFDQPPPIQSLVPSVPAELAGLVHRMLAKRADERPSMASIVQQLDAVPIQGVSAVGPVPAPIPRTLLEHTNTGPGTLTQAPSQSGLGSPASSASKRSATLIASGVFGVVLAALGIAWQLGGKHPERKVSATMDPSEHATPIQEAVPPIGRPQGGTTTQGMEKEVGLPVKHRVKWLIRSTPPGATIIQESDQTRLGQTPWTTEIATETGEQKLLLRLPGYEDTSIDVPKDRDTDFHVEMIRVEEPKATPTMRPAVMGTQTPPVKKSASPVAPGRPVGVATPPKTAESNTKPSTPIGDKANSQKTTTPSQSPGKNNKRHDDFELLE